MAVPRTTIRRASLLAAVLLSTALAACGGSSGGSTTTAQPSASSSAAATSTTTSAPGATGTTLAVGAVEKGEDHLGFTSRQLSARAGTVTIRLANGTGNEYPHGIAIEGNGVDKDGAIVKPGNATSVSVTLRPGRYTFYCPVHEHEKYGMKGTLTVT
jgi:plastocyanin